MFAGAAREAVFSNPDVIRRVKAGFVAVALKAALVNHPPGDEEGRLYREIGRSRIAPQGICVVNSAGKVLDWVTMFDDDKSVLAFLDHARKRFATYPDAKRPVPAERYLKFPSAKLADVKDNGKVLMVRSSHPRGKCCPAQPLLPRGTVVARVFGRALGKDGKPMADTIRQEHYVEDRFQVPVAMQETLARALTDAGTDRFRLADDLARLLVSHAFLGQLDVNPLGGAPDGKGALKHCEFWAQKIEAGGNGPVRVRVAGKSEAARVSSVFESGDGRVWQHAVKLTWEGIIELKAKRMSRLLLLAHGSEKLRWGNKAHPLQRQADVTHLPAGHAIDLRCGVRYGLIGTPVAADQAEAADAAPQRPQQAPADARRQLVQALGGPFLVFRNKVQKELKLSDQQKEKLLAPFADHVQETRKCFAKIQAAKPREREKLMQEHRQKSHERLAAVLKDVLDARQQERLLQLQLQQGGSFALLGQPEAFTKLKITDEQRAKFREVVQDLQNKIQPLLKKAHAGVNPEVIHLKIMKIRQEHEGRIEAILSAAQKKQWKELLGKPLDLDD